MTQIKGLLITIVVVVFLNVLVQLIVIGIANDSRHNINTIVGLFGTSSMTVYVLNVFILLFSLTSFILGIIILGLKKSLVCRKLIIATSVLCIVAFPVALVLTQIIELPIFITVFILSAIALVQIYKSESRKKTAETTSFILNQ